MAAHPAATGVMAIPFSKVILVKLRCATCPEGFLGRAIWYREARGPLSPDAFHVRRPPVSPQIAGYKSRRTFAIIAHPDAGNTTLTEKLLLNSGAIHLAGEVKGRGERRRTRSDWMEIEQKRGISISSSVMTFEHDGLTLNLLDTPGHADFSEDT